MERVTPALDAQGYFCAVPTKFDNADNIIVDNQQHADHWNIRSLQDGVVRTNCMDCLDRTNVVQSMFGRYVLYKQLYERLGLSSKRRTRKRTLPLESVTAFKQHQLTLPWTQGESSHRYLWADNADAISRLYAGTPALKGDFTRTGQRTKRGALDDGMNSLQRYYLNNFIDADRQEGMDLLVGSTDFNVMPTNDGIDDESTRVFVMQELERSGNKRRGFDDSHARIKVRPDGSDSRKLSLKWLPGDLRHHMRNEALRSRSPLSSAAAEENIESAPTSSDFLLKVTSSAAGEEDASNEPLDAIAVDNDTHHVGVLHSIDRRASSAKPWWIVASPGEEDRMEITNLRADEEGLSITRNLGGRLSSQNILGFAKKRVMATSLLLLSKAPILSAWCIAALIGGLYLFDDEDDYKSDNNV